MPDLDEPVKINPLELEGYAMATDPIAKPSAAGTSDSVKEMISQRLVDNDLQLPPMPGVAQRILQMNPDATANELAKVVMDDQAITSSIIRIANSAYYGGRYKFDTLPTAIVRIGLQQVWVLALGFSILSQEFQANRFKKEYALLCEHAIGCAYLSGLLAEITRFPNKEDAFFGGLMHDIGKIVIYTVLDEEQQKEENPHWSDEVIREVVEEHHPEVGAFVAASWNLQPWMKDVSRFHHRFRETAQNGHLVCIVALANRFCHLFGFGAPKEEIDVLADGLGDAARFKPENLERVLNQSAQIKDLISKLKTAG